MLTKVKLKENIVLYASILIYLIALTQISFSTLIGPEAKGIMDLLTGWMGILILHPPAFIWLANPILIFSWVLFKKNIKKSLFLSVISLVIMLSFLFVREIIINESGAVSQVTGYGFGYWLWISSALIMVTGNTFYQINEANKS